MTAALAVGVQAAQAQDPVPICATGGHAYLTQPGGRVYFSGYDGDQRFGIPKVVATQGEFFRVGANGALPRVNVKFEAFRVPDPGQSTGTKIDFLPGRSVYFTQPAGDNCVVNEEGPYKLTAPTGKYRIFATYTSGNQRPREVFEVVMDLEVLPGLPGSFAPQLLPPPDDPGGGGGPSPTPSGPSMVTG